MRLRLAGFGVLFAAVVTASACAPTIRIARTAPAPFTLRDGQKVAVVTEADGTPPTANTVMEAAIGVSQGQLMNKWLAVEPLRQELDAQLRQTPLQLVDRKDAEVLIRAVPVNWQYQMDPKSGGRQGGGRLEVRIEVLDAKNPSAAPIYKDTYWATAGAQNIGEPESMLRASRNLTARFIEDMQPQRIWTEVELDDDDPAVKPGIELCKRGQFDAAYAAFTDIAARNPSSAPALYNLAVLSEARGEYDAAESLLLKATQINSKAIYYSALDRTRAARSDYQALQAQRGQE